MAWNSFRKDPSNTGQTNIPLYQSSKSKTGDIGQVYLGGLIWGTPVHDGRGRIYVGSTNKRFYCINTKEGNPIIEWQYRIKDRADSLIDSAGALSPSGHQVVVPGGDGFLHALDAHTGKVQWLFHAGEDALSDVMHSSGVIVNSFEGNVRYSEDSTHIYVGNDNASFYCIDATTGQKVWEFQTRMMVWTVPALLGGLVIFGSLDGYIYILDAANGHLQAKYNTKGEIKSSPVALSLDAIYVANSNGTILRLQFDTSLKSIQVMWRQQFDAEIYGSMALKDNMLVASTMDGFLIAMSTQAGTVHWKTNIGDYSTASPIITSDDRVIVTNSNGRLMAATLSTGAIEGCVALSKDDKNINSSPIQLHTGEIVVGCYDGSIYIVPASVLLASSDRVSTIDPSKEGTTHLKLTSNDSSFIQSIRLYAYDRDGNILPNASINHKSVSIVPPLPNYDIVVSPDGKFINLIPLSLEAIHEHGLHQEYTVSGTYTMLTNSWVADRFNFSTAGKFSEAITLQQHTQPTQQSQPVLISASPSSKTPIRFDISQMAVSQPTILDTYIPAAMDGQGFIGYITNVDTQKRTFDAIFVPAIPDDELPFQILQEPSKVLHLTGNFHDNYLHFQSKSSFTFSAMGGTITFSKFELFGYIDPVSHNIERIEFYARASCLKIKGNGKSYEFSPEIVNQLCDWKLDTHVIGSAHAKHNKDTKWRNSKNEKHLVVQYDPTTSIMNAHIANKLPLLPSSACTTLTLVDGLVYKSPSLEHRAATCWKPSTSSDANIFSSDGFFINNTFAPIIHFSCRSNIHPNIITISSMITTILMLYFDKTMPFIVPFLMMYKWFADALDGPVARTCNKTSKLGGTLDTAADFLFTMIVLVLFANRLWPTHTSRAQPLVWGVAAAIAMAPWLSIVLANGGPSVLHSHNDFKNTNNTINYITWLLTENTFLLILATSVAYMAILRL